MSEIEKSEDKKIVLRPMLSNEDAVIIARETLKNLEPGIRAPEIGDKMPDGTIYAGVSPDTNEPMFVMAQDVPLTMIFNQAKKYASKIDAHGHNDWRLPTKAELNVLFQNKDKGSLKGTFNVNSSDHASCYWSDTLYDDFNAFGQSFDNGHQSYYGKTQHSSVRCVRYGTGKAAPSQNI